MDMGIQLYERSFSDSVEVLLCLWLPVTVQHSVVSTLGTTPLDQNERGRREGQREGERYVRVGSGIGLLKSLNSIL